MTVNKFIGIGFCGKDPEIRTTKDGREIASFSIGISEKWKDKNSGEQKSKTEWVNISVFGSLVNVVKNYVKKGSKVYVEGSLQTREYEKSGVKCYATQVVLQGFNSTIQLLDSKKDGEISKHAQDKGDGFAPQSNHVEEEQDDEITF